MPNLQTYRLADNPNQQEWVFFDDATQLPTAPQVTGGLVNTANWVWDTGALMWAKETQAGGGGGGGPATIADGADVAEGATTDAAIVTGAAGTISGKLRGLVTILASVWDSGNGRVKVDASGVPVPVTGTFFQATQPVSGTFFQATQPVSAATLPLPTGAATEATLGTLLKPADTLTKVSTVDTITNPVTVTGSVTTSGTVAATQSGTWTVQQGGSPWAVSQSGTWNIGTVTAVTSITNPVTVTGTVTANTGLSQPLTDTQLRAAPVPISGTVTANTGLTQPLTDTQLRATPVPVSGTVTVDTSLLATAAKQDTGNTSLSTIAGAVKTEDAAAASGDTGIPAMAIREDNLSVNQSASGDYARFKVDAYGRQWVQDDVASAQMTRLNAMQAAALAASIAGFNTRNGAGFVPFEVPSFLGA